GVRWVEGRGRVVLDDLGRVAGMTGVVMDVTDRKRAEEHGHRLFDAEQSARQAAETAGRALLSLQGITQAALVHTALDDLLRDLLSRVRELLRADALAILLAAEDAEELTVRAAIGLIEEVSAGGIPFGRGVAGTVAGTR